MDMARSAAVRRGVKLEQITVAWMVGESVIAIGAGIAARSVLLTAFGFDAVVELLSGIVVLRLLATEAGGATTVRVERLERTTTRIAAVLLVMLCVYVVISSAAGLALRIAPDPAPLGLSITAAALIAMPLLARAKRAVNHVINSASLRADIAETVSCAYLAAIALVGLGLSMLLGWWWAQYVAAVALLIWLAPETREALESARKRTVDESAGR